MKFSKYQGAGNDFVIVDGTDGFAGDQGVAAASVCDRRYGVGADGFIVAMPSDIADIRMSYYNSDGSIAGMCGNGIRCFAKFVTDHGLVTKKQFSVETGDGIKTVEIVASEPLVTTVSVDMGRAGQAEEVTTGGNASGRVFEGVFTHLGVPHFVIFNDADGAELDREAEETGSAVENDERFAPERTNVNYVHVYDSSHIYCTTWERGAGKTLACGTGACSAALAAHLFRACGSTIVVRMPGGEVTVSFAGDGTVYMKGTAELTFTGTVPENRKKELP